MYDLGDMVLLNGQKTSFFEVIKVEGNDIWVTDGHVQVKRTVESVQLICKAEDRQDNKVPVHKYWKS